MFPQCYFNPYFREAIMDNSCSDNLQEEQPRMQQSPVQEEQASRQQPTVQQQPAMPTPTNFDQAPGSPTILDVEYTQGYLRTQIGKRVKIFFLIGTNIVQDRDGILTDVGISYVILRELETNYKILCDIYAIKFVTIYP